MIVLWFYLVMAVGSYGGVHDLASSRPEAMAGPFKTQADCLKHRGAAKDGVSNCVSVRVRWLSSAPPPWSWVPDGNYILDSRDNLR